jgi:tRNA dimethylallyltransferase
MKQIIAIVGPTASGKTDVALELAEALGTEIVSADSMQFYRGMEIGTGQPTPAQLARVRHHFIGHLAPDEFMSAAAYAEAARAVVARLNAAGKPAIVAGGSGLYLRALIDGLFEGPGRSCEIRQRLHAQAEAEGTHALHAQLQTLDPVYAAKVLPGDLRRIVRALEVHELTGKPLSAHHAEQKAAATASSTATPNSAQLSRELLSPATAVGTTVPIRPIGPIPPILPITPISPNAPQPLATNQFALDWPREILYDRINRRVAAMFAAGLIEEVESLLKSGYETQVERLKSLGYREILAHLRGQATLADTIAAIQMNHRRYAKRQLTWFRRDTRIQWHRMDAEVETFDVKTVAERIAQTLPE